MNENFLIIQERFFTTLAKDMGIVSSTKYLARLITFAINLLLIFLLPPEGLGIYILAFAFAGLGSKFIDLRVESAVIKFVSESKERDLGLIKKITFSALKINLILDRDLVSGYPFLIRIQTIKLVDTETMKKSRGYRTL